MKKYVFLGGYDKTDLLKDYLINKVTGASLDKGIGG